MRSRLVLMWRERYADDMPLRLPKTQLPPTRSLFSKTSKGMPASWSFLAAAMPLEPAPMMHAFGSAGMVWRVAEVDSGVNFVQRTLFGDGARPHAHGPRHLGRRPLHALRGAARRRALPVADPAARGRAHRADGRHIRGGRGRCPARARLGWRAPRLVLPGGRGGPRLLLRRARGGQGVP